MSNVLYSRDFFGYDQYKTLVLTDPQPSDSTYWVEPLSLTEVKEYLKLPIYTDAALDASLNSFITAAREQAEIAQGRDLVKKQYDMTLDYLSWLKIRLRAPLVSVDLFTYKDVTGTVNTLTEFTSGTPSPGQYIVDKSKQPGLVQPPWNTTWPIYLPWPTSAVMIRFTAGYTASSPFWKDAGQRVKTGMLMLISAWFENRIPYTQSGVSTELPYAITSCLSHGALNSVK